MTPFELSEKQKLQRDLAASPATHILAYGGSRSGKTFGFCYCVAVRALSTPGSRHLIARKQNIDVRQSVMMDTWPSMMKKAFPGVEYNLNKQDQFLILPNESEVWLTGLDEAERAEKALGKEFATIYLNECSQIAYTSVNLVRTRLAQRVYKTNGQPLSLKMYYDLNPVGKAHWTYQEFIEGKRPNSEQKLLEGSRAYLHMNPMDNPFLPPEYVTELSQLPEKERQRFLEGKYILEVPNALWTMEAIDRSRVDKAPVLSRIVISVDPSGSDGTGGDAQGIVVTGKTHDGHAYVLEDASDRLPPSKWGSRAVALYKKWNADLIVAEANYGGAMVAATIRAVDDRVPVKLVNASRGKHVRAEPIAALYDKRGESPPLVHHVGVFPDLEEEMTAFTSDGYEGSGSPNRADALVWGLTELMLKKRAPVAATGQQRRN